MSGAREEQKSTQFHKRLRYNNQYGMQELSKVSANEAWKLDDTQFSPQRKF